MGLGGGEARLAGAAYVVAGQVTCEEGAWLQRLRPLVPYAVLVSVWRVLYGALGFGATGSSLYLDPADQPVLFLRALLERMPLFLGAQMLQAPVDFWMLLPRGAQIAASIVSAVLLGGLLRVFWSLLRREALARFWALGMALSLVPFCTTFPQVRLLVFAGLGGCGLLAMLFESAGGWRRKPAAAGGRRGVAALLFLVHGPVAAILVPVSVAALPILGQIT